MDVSLDVPLPVTPGHHPGFRWTMSVMKGRPLPTIDAGCPSCSRRELLAGTGALAASLLVGCGGGDAEPMADAAITTGGNEMCGAGWCVDLAHPANAPLLEIEGQRALVVPGDKIIVVRTSATEFAVVSRVCTHNGCSVAYAPASDLLVCPCHGSRFMLTGAVEREPATRALRRYASTFDETTQILTITL